MPLDVCYSGDGPGGQAVFRKIHALEKLCGCLALVQISFCLLFHESLRTCDLERVFLFYQSLATCRNCSMKNSLSISLFGKPSNTGLCKIYFFLCYSVHVSVNTVKSGVADILLIVARFSRL